MAQETSQAGGDEETQRTQQQKVVLVLPRDGWQVQRHLAHTQTRGLPWHDAQGRQKVRDKASRAQPSER